MAVRTDVRTLVRDELNDNGTVKIWTDALINAFILEAIRDYGRQAGREASTSLTSVASQAAYALPAGTLQVVRLEHPSGYFRKVSPYRSGDEEQQPGRMIGLAPGELVYEVWGTNVILSPVPTASSEAIGVRYLATFTEPASDATVLDVPDVELPALVYFACRRALLWITSDEAKRQRFERQRGSDPRDAANEYQEMYQSMLRTKQGARVSSRRLAVRE